jgi:hypothetical protein
MKTVRKKIFLSCAKESSLNMSKIPPKLAKNVKSLLHPHQSLMYLLHSNSFTVECA